MPAGIHAFASQGEASAAKGGGSLQRFGTVVLMTVPQYSVIMGVSGD
ncbi:MAG: hypothetical protein WCD13_19125 [Pseudolabrys sp.]